MTDKDTVLKAILSTYALQCSTGDYDASKAIQFIKQTLEVEE